MPPRPLGLNAGVHAVGMCCRFVNRCGCLPSVIPLTSNHSPLTFIRLFKGGGYIIYGIYACAGGRDAGRALRIFVGGRGRKMEARGQKMKIFLAYMRIFLYLCALLCAKL